MRFLRVSLCSFYYVKGLDSCSVLFCALNCKVRITRVKTTLILKREYRQALVSIIGLSNVFCPFKLFRFHTLDFCKTNTQ